MKLLIAILIAACIYSIVRVIYYRHWEDGLEIVVDFADEVVREGDTSTLKCTITNGKWLPLPVLIVKFAITRTFIFKNMSGSAVTDQYYRNEYFTMKPYERLIRSYPFVCSKRGLFGMRDMDVICKDLFLSSEMYAGREHEARLAVLPKRIASINIPDEIHKLMGEIESNLRFQEDPFAFSMIREYQPYDSMHSVNWKSSARMDKLMVNTFNTTLQREVVIIMNLTSNSAIRIEPLQEKIIRIAATLSANLISKKIPVAVVSNGRDCESNISLNVGAGADLRHIHTIELALARIDLNKEMDGITGILDSCGIVDPKTGTGNHDNIHNNIRNNAKEYILISNERKDWLSQRVENARNMGSHITCILPLTKDEATLPGVNQFISDTKAIRWVMDDE